MELKFSQKGEVHEKKHKNSYHKLKAYTQASAKDLQIRFGQNDMKGKHTDISRKLYSHGRGNQEQRRKVQRERIEDETTDENCLFFFFFVVVWTRRELF